MFITGSETITHHFGIISYTTFLYQFVKSRDPSRSARADGVTKSSLADSGMAEMRLAETRVAEMRVAEMRVTEMRVVKAKVLKCS